MRLEKLHIYGYGKLENVELDLSAITILYGENEAGKSTIRSFIKSVLFGFPIRGQYRYEPKTGGAYGGAITMQTEEYGRIRVERLPKTAAGEAAVYLEDGTQAGEEVLVRLLQGMDASLFESVFSFDMHGLQNIHHVSKEELGNYLFSAGAVGTDLLLQLEKKLERELESLFKPNGRKPIINAGLQEVHKLRENVQKWQQKLDTYEEWQKKKQDCEERLEAIQIEKEEMQRHIKDCETMQALQPLLIERQKYEDFLQTLSVSSFPADGIARYETLLAEWKPVQSQMQTLSQKIEGAKRSIADLAVDFGMLEKEPLAEECRLQHMSYETAKQELQLIVSSIQQMEGELEEFVISVGISRDASFFLQLDTSLAAKESILQTVQKAQRLADKKQQLDERFANAQEQLEEQEERVRHVEEQRRTAETRSKQQADSQTHHHAQRDNKITSILGIFLALSVISLIAGVLGRNASLSLVSVVLFAAVIVLFVMNRHAGQHSSTEQGIEMRQLAEQEKFKLQQAEKAYERIVTQYEEWERQTYGLDREIERHKQAYSLPSALSYSQLLPAFERIEKMKQLQREITKQMERSQLLSKDIEQFEQKVSQLKTAFRVTGSSVSSTLSGIYERLKKEIENQLTKQQLQQKLAEWEEEQKEIIHTDEKLRKERGELWETAGVLAEEDFYERGKEYKEVQETKKQLSFIMTQISVLEERLISIHLSDRVTWTEDYRACLEQHLKKQEELQKEEQQLQAQAAQCKVEIANLEEGTAYSVLLHEWEAKKAQLREQMKKWAAYRTAKSILTKTKEQYHEVRFPRILETAEQYFRYVTKEQYVRLFAPTAEQVFIVERADGIRFFAHELSQATAEQLYLSLRLALADTFDAQVPLVIDDSFVHFDHGRTERTLSLLRMISEKRQVLFFTCHTHLLPFFAHSETVHLQEKIQTV